MSHRTMPLTIWHNVEPSSEVFVERIPLSLVTTYRYIDTGNENHRGGLFDAHIVCLYCYYRGLP